MAVQSMISIVILAQNEARNLETLLPTLDWADRVIVIDDNSTDNTREVCRRFDAECIAHELNNDFSAARNYAMSLIPDGWILFIDADERIDERLKDEIQRMKSNGDVTKGYQIRRVDVFSGKRLLHGETGDVWITRIGYAGHGEWVGKVHETWNFEYVQKIDGELLHYSHDSTHQLFEVVDHYALLRAKELFHQRKYWNAWEQISYPLGKFIYTFFVKMGFLDGWQGFMMSIAMSWHSFLVRWNLLTTPWEQNQSQKYIVILPFLLLPLGQFQRIQISQTVAINVFELVMGLAVILGLFILKKNIWSKFSFTALWWLIGVMMIATVSPNLYLLRWILYVLFFAVIYTGNVTEKIKISWQGLLEYVGFGLLGFGWLQYVLIPDTRWLFLLGWDDHYFRMIGSLFDPNFMGLMLVLLGILISYMYHGRKRWILLAVTAAALVLTYSRLSWATAVLVSLGMSKRWWLIPVIGLGIAIVLFLAPKPGGQGVNLLRTYSISSRVESMSIAVNVFLKRPVLGVGFNNYPAFITKTNLYGQPFHPSAPDNSYLFVLGTTGIIGFSIFVWWLIQLFRKTKQSWIMWSIIAILIHSLGNNSFFYPWVLMWLWMMLVSDTEAISKS